jgi:hypothetical protein
VAKLTGEQREALAEKRILSVLSTLVVANQRTIEQKISDAGPGDQRVDPHILTTVRARLIQQGVIGAIDWRKQGLRPRSCTSPDAQTRGKAARRSGELAGGQALPFL